MKITLEFDNVIEMQTELPKLINGLGGATVVPSSVKEQVAAPKKETSVKKAIAEIEKAEETAVPKVDEPKFMTLEEAKAKAISFKIPPAELSEIVKKYNAVKFTELDAKDYEAVLADIEAFATANPDKCRK